MTLTSRSRKMMGGDKCPLSLPEGKSKMTSYPQSPLFNLKESNFFIGHRIVLGSQKIQFQTTTTQA